jgi:hypothetical protein
MSLAATTLHAKLCQIGWSPSTVEVLRLALQAAEGLTAVHAHTSRATALRHVFGCMCASQACDALLGCMSSNCVVLAAGAMSSCVGKFGTSSSQPRCSSSCISSAAVVSGVAVLCLLLPAVYEEPGQRAGDDVCAADRPHSQHCQHRQKVGTAGCIGGSLRARLPAFLQQLLRLCLHKYVLHTHLHGCGGNLPCCMSHAPGVPSSVCACSVLR